MERCLTFEAGGLLMYVPADCVMEIITEYTITNLPLVPEHIRGIINLRGTILPVVELQRLMKHSPAARGNAVTRDNAATPGNAAARGSNTTPDSTAPNSAITDSAAPYSTSTAENDIPCMIVLDLHTSLLGVLVREVRQVMDIETEALQPVPLRKHQRICCGMLTLSSGETAMALDTEALAKAQGCLS